MVLRFKSYNICITGETLHIAILHSIHNAMLPALMRRGIINMQHSSLTVLIEIPYMAKLSRGKTFAVVHKTHHSLENFRGASGPYHYILYTANDSRGKLSRLAKKPRKPRKFSPRKFCHIRYFTNVGPCVHI